ncbi:hypothetical protein AB0E69_03070 [Kribbella sp. NPDC026611]|uniref:hypothetical protein n=1 Tax=Kribbella sp. NPDC026611 TaxID=3154911 RepID=UPI0033C9E08A
MSASWLAPNPEFRFSTQPAEMFASVTEDSGLPVLGLQAEFFLVGLFTGVDQHISKLNISHFQGHTQPHAAGTYSFLLTPATGEGEGGMFVVDVMLLVVSVRGAGHQAQTTCTVKYDRGQRLP